MGRWQAGVPVLQATFLPGQALVLAAAGGDGAVHLLDLGSPLCKPSTKPANFGVAWMMIMIAMKVETVMTGVLEHISSQILQGIAMRILSSLATSVLSCCGKQLHTTACDTFIAILRFIVGANFRHIFSIKISTFHVFNLRRSNARPEGVTAYLSVQSANEVSVVPQVLHGCCVHRAVSGRCCVWQPHPMALCWQPQVKVALEYHSVCHHKQQQHRGVLVVF